MMDHDLNMNFGHFFLGGFGRGPTAQSCGPGDSGGLHLRLG